MLTIHFVILHQRPSTSKWVAFVYFTNGDSGMFGNGETDADVRSHVEALAQTYGWGEVVYRA